MNLMLRRQITTQIHLKGIINFLINFWNNIFQRNMWTCICVCQMLLLFPQVPSTWGLKPATLLKKRLWHRCLPANFMKFLRTPFYTEHVWWLLLFMVRIETCWNLRLFKNLPLKHALLLNQQPEAYSKPIKMELAPSSEYTVGCTCAIFIYQTSLRQNIKVFFSIFLYNSNRE